MARATPRVMATRVKRETLGKYEAEPGRSAADHAAWRLAERAYVCCSAKSQCEVLTDPCRHGAERPTSRGEERSADADAANRLPSPRPARPRRNAGRRPA